MQRRWLAASSFNVSGKLLHALSLMLLFAYVSEAKTVITAVRMGGQGRFEALAKEYMNLHPDIEIRHIPNVATGTYEGISQILLMTGTTNQPDIIHAYLAIAPEMYYGKMFASPPTLIQQKVERFFIPQILRGVTFEGRLMGIPTENQTYMLGYNRRALEESGYAEPPVTWDELRKSGAKLTRVNGDGKVTRYAFSITPSSAGDPVQFAHAFLGFLWANGGAELDERGNPQFDQKPARETLEFLADLAKAGYMAIDGKSIANGQSVMSVMPTWWRLGLKQSSTISYGDIRAAALPIQAGPHTAPQYGWGLFVSSRSPHQEEAWAFLDWLTMQVKEDGRTRMGDIQVQIGLPTNRNDMENQPLYREEALLKDYLGSLAYARSEPSFVQMSARQKLIGDHLMPVLQGNAAPQNALIELQRQTKNALAAGLQRK